MWKDPFWVKVFLLKLFAFRAYKSKSCRKQNVFDPSHIFHTLPLLHHSSSKILNIRYSVLESRLTLASSLRALTLLSVVAMWWITAMLSTASKLSSCNRALLGIDNDSWHLKWWLRQNSSDFQLLFMFLPFSATLPTSFIFGSALFNLEMYFFSLCLKMLFSKICLPWFFFIKTKNIYSRPIGHVNSLLSLYFLFWACIVFLNIPWWRISYLLFTIYFSSWPCKGGKGCHTAKPVEKRMSEWK